MQSQLFPFLHYHTAQPSVTGKVICVFVISKLNIQEIGNIHISSLSGGEELINTFVRLEQFSRKIVNFIF